MKQIFDVWTLVYLVVLLYVWFLLGAVLATFVWRDLEEDEGGHGLSFLFFWPKFLLRAWRRRRVRRAKEALQRFCPRCNRREGDYHEDHCPYVSGMPYDVRERYLAKRRQLHRIANEQ